MTTAPSSSLILVLSPLDEILPRKALRIEERGKVSALNARARSSGDLGLGAIGDAKAGGLQHRKIVGAVPNRQRLVKREPYRGSNRLERVKLGVLADDRLDDL